MLTHTNTGVPPRLPPRHGAKLHSWNLTRVTDMAKIFGVDEGPVWKTLSSCDKKTLWLAWYVTAVPSTSTEKYLIILDFTRLLTHHLHNITVLFYMIRHFEYSRPVRVSLTSCIFTLGVHRSASAAFQGTTMHTKWADDACASCPGGQKRNKETSGCIACSPGQFALANNINYECDLCDVGTYSGDASDDCTNCTVGQYNDRPGQPTCTSCTDAGELKFTDLVGQESCGTCKDGLKASSNADECVCVKPCAKGT